MPAIRRAIISSDQHHAMASVPHVPLYGHGFGPPGQSSGQHSGPPRGSARHRACARYLTAALLTAFVLTGQIRIGAQAPQPNQTEPSSSAPILHVNAELVLLDVAVTNRKTGEILGPLTLSDLELTEDGTPQKLSYLSHDELPLSIVFLFDVTDSVRPVLHHLAEGAAGVLQHLGDRDEAAVLIFSSHTERLLGFARRHDLIADAISRAAEKSTHEATFLDEDIFEAVDLLHQATEPQSRRVLLWLTDGTTNVEDDETKRLHGRYAPDHLHTEQEATDALLRSGAASAMLQQVSRETQLFSPVLRLNGRFDRFNRFAELTGGPVLTTGDADAARRMSLLLDNLRARTTVGFRPGSPKPAGTHCKLALTLTASFFASHPELAAHRKDLLIQARKEYVR